LLERAFRMIVLACFVGNPVCAILIAAALSVDEREGNFRGPLEFLVRESKG